MGISALVLTYNEQNRIERCLDSLAFADEIIIVDSYSTDRTLEIAGRYTSNIVQRELTSFSDQRNAAIDLAAQDWILFIDADEVVSKELAAEIIKSVDRNDFEGFRMPRSTFFLGKRMRHCGWYPDYQLRLMRREKARIPNRIVHESLLCEGPVGTLKNPIIHYSYDSMADYSRKMVLYAKAAAEQKYNEGRSFHIIDILLNPGHSFCKMYIAKRGFMDGMHGLVLSSLTACSSILRYAYLWDLCRSKKEVSHEK